MEVDAPDATAPEHVVQGEVMDVGEEEMASKDTVAKEIEEDETKQWGTIIQI